MFIISYVIGSFNLRDFNFSNVSNDVTNEQLKRNFEKIASIIIEEKFDVVALQEINAQLPLEYLTRIINCHKNRLREYQCCFGANMPSASRDPERYGFIWNTKRLRLINTSRGSNPGYYENAGALGLIRPPYYARFTSRGMLGGTNFELRIVNTHIRDASRESDKIKEFDVLVKQILPRICDHQDITKDGEIMPSYTFLMGDYNLALNKSENSIYKIETVTTTTYTGKKRDFRTVQEEKTTLRIPNGQPCIEDCYANNYDHFTYEISLDRKLLLIPQRIETLNKYYMHIDKPAEKLRTYRREVSDHVPICLKIDFM